MSGTTWTKFFWSDWDTDPALRLCSFGAQGLWMRMLCIAAAHDQIGYVAVAGRGLNETSIARMTGGSESEVRDLLGELDQNGVFSRDRQGRIYSRRMINDAKRAAIAKKNGKQGGNPSLSKDTTNSTSDNPQDNGGLKTQEPEAIIQKEKPPTPLEGGAEDLGSKRRPRKALPDAFPTPELIEEQQQKARELGADIDLSTEADRFRNWAIGKDAKFVEWSAAWRNWAGKAIGWAPKAQGFTPRSAEPTDPWPKRLKNFRLNQYWHSDWGPKPGKPDCTVPTEALMSAGYQPPPAPVANTERQKAQA